MSIHSCIMNAILKKILKEQKIYGSHLKNSWYLALLRTRIKQKRWENLWIILKPYVTLLPYFDYSKFLWTLSYNLTLKQNVYNHHLLGSNIRGVSSGASRSPSWVWWKYGAWRQEAWWALLSSGSGAESRQQSPLSQLWQNSAQCSSCRHKEKERLEELILLLTL